VLRICPVAHQVWLSLAAPSRKLYELPRPWRFDTQRWQMFDSPRDVVEPIEGISVLQAADIQPVDGKDGKVQITDRGQVLDGIVNYGDELLIVIETKLDGPVATRQAQDLNVHGAPVRFDGGLVSVSWRHLLAAWYDLIESEVVVGAERTIIVDFLDFVERWFPRVGPFMTLARCKCNGFRVNRRLNAVLDQIAGGLTKEWLELPSRSTIDRAYLHFEQSSRDVRLVMYPADTLTQAKTFYAHPEHVSRMLALRDSGWNVEPNFHFGHIAPGLVWTTTDAPLEEYVGYWREHIEGTGAVQRVEWGDFWRQLVERQFATDEEKAKFDQSFTNTRRSSATPRPGLCCSYSWKLSDAERLDDGGRLVVAVEEQLNVMLRALGEKPHESTHTRT